MDGPSGLGLVDAADSPRDANELLMVTNVAPGDCAEMIKESLVPPPILSDRRIGMTGSVTDGKLKLAPVELSSSSSLGNITPIIIFRGRLYSDGELTYVRGRFVLAPRMLLFMAPLYGFAAVVSVAMAVDVVRGQNAPTAMVVPIIMLAGAILITAGIRFGPGRKSERQIAEFLVATCNGEIRSSPGRIRDRAMAWRRRR